MKSLPNPTPLDAKKAALDAHFKTFKRLRRAGHHAEAMRQFQVTLSAADDLLNAATHLVRNATGSDAIQGHDAAPPQAGKALHVPAVQHVH